MQLTSTTAASALPPSANSQDGLLQGPDPRSVQPLATRMAEPGPGPAPQDEDHLADRAFHAAVARLTGGISPVALSLAFVDWAWHLAAAPQRQLEIGQEAQDQFFVSGFCR